MPNLKSGKIESLYTLYKLTLTPGSKIKIISENKAKKIKPDYYLVLPWHFKNFIINKEKDFLKKDKKLIFPLPDIEIV